MSGGVGVEARFGPPFARPDPMPVEDGLLVSRSVAGMPAEEVVVTGANFAVATVVMAEAVVIRLRQGDVQSRQDQPGDPRDSRPGSPRRPTHAAPFPENRAQPSFILSYPSRKERHDRFRNRPKTISEGKAGGFDYFLSRISNPFRNFSSSGFISSNRFWPVKQTTWIEPCGPHE